MEQWFTSRERTLTHRPNRRQRAWCQLQGRRGLGARKYSRHRKLQAGGRRHPGLGRESGRGRGCGRLGRSLCGAYPKLNVGSFAMSVLSGNSRFLVRCE